LPSNLLTARIPAICMHPIIFGILLTAMERKKLFFSRFHDTFFVKKSSLLLNQDFARLQYINSILCLVIVVSGREGKKCIAPSTTTIGRPVRYHLCLLFLVRVAGYIANLLDFYSYRLIGKLTAFLQLQEFSQRNLPVEDSLFWTKKQSWSGSR
jgi:hypothetical protein